MTITTPGIALPAAVHTPWHLTDEQLSFFDDNGYLVLRNRIPAPLLARLQDATARLIERGREAGPGAPDHLWANRNGKQVMWRVDYVHAKDEAATLELLGSPAVLGIAESMAGVDFVPTYESLVFKDTGDGAPVAWHQDAVHPRRHRIVNVDVYLDNSLSGQGALWVVPGSQRGKIDACEIADEHGWNIPGAIEVEMAPGDVLLHDVMVVHGSQPTVGNALRRTLYYEFRSASQIREEGPWEPEWVDARLRLIPVALDAYAAQYPQDEQFTWNAPADVRPVTSGDREAELRIVHEIHTPGSFCSAGDVKL